MNPTWLSLPGDRQCRYSGPGRPPAIDSSADTRFQLAGHNIVCFSTADWDTLLPTNKHQLMLRLARRNRVLFVETLGTRSPRLSSGTDWTRIARRLGRTLEGPRRRQQSLWTLSPLVRPSWGTAAARLANRTAFRAQAASALRRFPKPILWIYSPYAIHLLALFEPRLVIYHLVDDLAAVPGADRDALREAEKRLLARADAVFCTERSLYDRARQVNQRARFMPNVADYRHFAHPPRNVRDARLTLLESLSRPRIVFSGNLAPHKVDVRLIADLSERRRDWSFVLIGPFWEGPGMTEELASLQNRRNVHLLGHVSYRDLPAYLNEADVLLIPYLLNEATRAVFPLKFFEYLATGKPVVASPLPSLLPYTGAIHLARDRAEWEEKIERALDDTHDLEIQRRALARKHTWKTRLWEMEREIGSLLGKE